MDGIGDVDQMLLHLNYFWTVVASDVPGGVGTAAPTKSRLTHGAGIQAWATSWTSSPTESRQRNSPGMDLETSVASLRAALRVDERNLGLRGRRARRWNGIQNTPNDVRLLTSHLLRAPALTLVQRTPSIASHNRPQLVGGLDVHLCRGDRLESGGRQ